MREPCRRCLRSPLTCYCAQLPQLPTRTRVVFLQHPRERRVAIGTARMAHLSLPNSELYQGVDFAGHARLEALGRDPGGVAVLFPGPGAEEPEAFAARGLHTLIVVDGTWPLAKKLIRTNPFLAALPRMAFTPRRPGNYRIRAEPAEHCVATIEAVAEVLGRLEGEPHRFDQLLQPFDFMVDNQLRFERERTGPPRHRLFKKPRQLPLGMRQLVARAPDLVVLCAEANAHPLGARIEPELVHLTARRLATGETFEAVLAPRRPLAEATPAYIELTREALLAGEPVPQALARLAAFLRPDDALAVWGTFSLDLLRAEGLAVQGALDVREARVQLLQRKVGGVEQAAEESGGQEAPWTGGRAGRRVAALEAVTRALLRVAEAGAPPPRRECLSA